MSESEQNLAGQQVHEEKLRRYLLGQCSADELGEIERAAFQDNSVSDALSVIEDELTEDYVSDQLNDFDRSCFELKFLTTSERREKLRLSALLLNRTEVLRRVPPGFVRAHQLVSQEMKEAFTGMEEGSYVDARVTGEVRESPGDALAEKISGPLLIALRPTPRRWKRWTALGALAVLLVLVLYGIRVRLSTPPNAPSRVLIPPPSIASVDLQRNDPRAGPLHPVLLVKGENFLNGATVQRNGSNLETVFVDSTELVAVIPETAVNIASLDKIQIVVVNPPGRGASPPFFLTSANPSRVLYPLPSITSVDLQMVHGLGVRNDDHGAGLPHSFLIVKGENFSEGATVQWNGWNLETLFVNSTMLRAVYPETSELTASTAKIQIVVVNPPPGSGASPPFILSPTLEK